jgi:hypothetical protein
VNYLNGSISLGSFEFRQKKHSISSTLTSCEKHCLFLGVENSLRGSILELISEKELASLDIVIPKLLTDSAEINKRKS